MKISELLEGIHPQWIHGSISMDVAGISCDSRECKKDDAFICISGSQYDSHSFIREMYDKGVRCFFVERVGDTEQWLFEEPEICIVCLQPMREKLADLAANYYGHADRSMSIIGITGTKGKTTVAHMLYELLSRAGNRCALIGTNGIRYGGKEIPTKNTTPDAYELHRRFAEMKSAGCNIVVMEASSQAVKMNRIRGILFTIGIFTNLSEDHIGPGEHTDMEEYKECKARFFAQCRHGIFNVDDLASQDMMQYMDGPYETYGIQKEECDWKASNVHYKATRNQFGMSMMVNGKQEYFVRTPGTFSVYNALAVLAAARVYEVPESIIREVFSDYRVEGRMEQVVFHKEFSIWIDYAHNAISMESVLQTMREYHPRRLISLFGCGGNRSRVRRFEMGEVSGRLADYSILTEDNSRDEPVESILDDIVVGINRTHGNYVRIPDRRMAIRQAIQDLQPGDLLLLLGKGHEKTIEKKGQFLPFYEREIVLAEMEEWYERNGTVDSGAERE